MRELPWTAIFAQMHLLYLLTKKTKKHLLYQYQLDAIKPNKSFMLHIVTFAPWRKETQQLEESKGSQNT